MKKIFAILGMITCMAGLCACGQETGQMSAEEQNLLKNSEMMVQYFNEAVSEGAVEEFAEQPVIYAGLLGLKDAMTDIGEFEGTNGGTAVVNDDELLAEVNVLGSSHNAVIEFVCDPETGAIQAITTNVTYSLGEIMMKALMNTVIGMGTVFVVLILISLIISCFTLISKIEDRKKKAVESAAGSNVAQPAPAAAAPAAQEELSDDTELVAVIAAAIAAYEGSGSTDGFVVRSIRKSNKSKWQNA